VKRDWETPGDDQRHVVGSKKMTPTGNRPRSSFAIGDGRQPQRELPAEHRPHGCKAIVPAAKCRASAAGRRLAGQ
jgi:hypothetical protein